MTASSASSSSATSTMASAAPKGQLRAALERIEEQALSVLAPIGVPERHDGVVRYVMVVLSPQGGRNVTYEGMRCESRERRGYASGRLDGSWSKARKNEWVRIQDAAANRQHAALFLEYFCPFGIIVRDADVARKALVQGIHPDNRR